MRVGTRYALFKSQAHHKIARCKNSVRRISTVFDNLGRSSTITQYDNATPGSGSVVDEMKYTYDDWGPVSKIEQDHNSTVATGGNLLYDVDFAYAKATTGRNAIQRSSMDLPDGTTVSYQYLSTSDRHDAEASRVTQVKISSTVLAEYGYNGVGHVVGIDHAEADIFMHHYGSTSGVYPNLDRFNRVASSVWTKDLATDVDFYDVDITYDRNSNIDLAEDNIHAGFDVDYTLDDRDRLTNAAEGTWNGSTITSDTRTQEWATLSQTGNWDRVKLDLNGDGDWGDTDEYDDTRDHNKANELTARDVNSDATDDYEPTLDGVGNLTDDDEHWEYEFDAFNRLRKVKDTSDQSLIAEYKYNGLGHRIVWHYDVDADGTVEDNGDDPWYHFVYNDRWQIVGVYRQSDSSATDDNSPKEQFVYHNAGGDGLGSSSYIDEVVMRYRDNTNGWSGAADGTLEQRHYYCQNWRHDVVAMLLSVGWQLEQVRYLAYGVPFGLPAGDCDSDGDTDATDATILSGWIGSSYDVRGDMDLDGDLDATDSTLQSSVSGESLGYGALSRSDMNNRKGYAGYEFEDALGDAYSVYHVRNRVLIPDLGRWLQRDPVGYVDGPNLYGYGRGNPLFGTDPDGLVANPNAMIDCAECDPNDPNSCGEGGRCEPAPLSAADYCCVTDPPPASLQPMQPQPGSDWWKYVRCMATCVIGGHPAVTLPGGGVLPPPELTFCAAACGICVRCWQVFPLVPIHIKAEICLVVCAPCIACVINGLSELDSCHAACSIYL